MSPTKKYMLKFGLTALVVWLGANFLLGPPGFSKEYMDQHKADHGRYLSISKSDAFKHYEQRPWLHQDEVSQADAEFVATYRAMPDFRKEERRQALYETFFDFFNRLLVVVLALHFGAKPLLGFLDQQIAAVRDRLSTAAEARAQARERREAAEAKLAGIPEEEEKIASNTRKGLDRELAELELANEHSLKVMAQEREDRKREEAHAAELLVKRELVNQAVDAVAAQYKAQRTAAHEAALVEQFARELEGSA